MFLGMQEFDFLQILITFAKISQFSVKVVNNTAASAAQSAKCILLHAYTRTTASNQLREYKKTSYSFLTSWHNSIFSHKLRTD